MTTTEPAVASGPPPRDQELTAFRDRVSALARSAHGRGLEGAPALNPDEIDQQRDRMLAALFPLRRETVRATTPGGDRGRERAEQHCGNDPDVTRLAYTVVEALAAHPSEPRMLDRSDKAASRVAAAFAKALGTPYLDVLGDRLRALAAPAEPAAGDTESWPRTTSDPDPLADVRVGDPDPTPEHFVEQRCPAERDQWVCTRETGHAGQHIAGDGTEGVRAVWTGCHVCGAGSDR